MPELHRKKSPIGCAWFMFTVVCITSTLVLIVMKLSGAVDMKWVWALMPALVGVGIPAFAVLFAVIIALITDGGGND